MKKKSSKKSYQELKREALRWKEDEKALKLTVYR